jgi:hypothetical protein
MVLKRLFAILLIMAGWAHFELSYGQDFDFRNTRWKMSQVQVLASEKMDPIQKNENFIKYKTKILNISVDLLYLFVNNQLIGASYTVNQIYLDSEKYKRTYNIFRRALMDKFGKPDEEITKWLNDRYKNDRSKWGLALGLGHVEYIATWQTQSSTIRCSLSGKNHDIFCTIKFSAIEHKETEHLLMQEKKVGIF